MITGFIGSNAHGETTTLGRGGSDYTASVIGAALDVKEIHGYRAELGLKVFTPEALNRKNTISAMGAMHAMQIPEAKVKVKK